MTRKNQGIDQAMESLLIRQAQEGSQEAMEHLLHSFRAMVFKLAQKYSRSKTALLEDLIQVGLLGLTLAVRRFDAASGNRLISYAYPTIQGAMLRHLRDNEQAIKLPRRLAELRTKAESVARHHRKSGLQEPTISQLASLLGASEQELVEAMNGPKLTSAVSLDAGTREGICLYDFLPETTSDVESLPDRPAVQQLLHQLDSRARAVLSMLFGLSGREPMLQKEVAQHLGISQMTVSRIRKEALETLKSQLCAAGV